MAKEDESPKRATSAQNAALDTVLVRVWYTLRLLICCSNRKGGKEKSGPLWLTSEVGNTNTHLYRPFGIEM